MPKIDFKNLETVKSPVALLKLAMNKDDISELDLPIDVKSIAQRIEKIKFSDDLSFEDFEKSGYIKVNRNEQSNALKDIKIWINSSEPKYRQRFTLAHEVGHLLLDVIPDLKDDNKSESFVEKLHRDGTSNFEERRANKFAARLVMPTILVKREVKKLIDILKKEDRKITANEASEKLATVFDVSSQAMRYRLESLGYIKR